MSVTVLGSIANSDATVCYVCFELFLFGPASRASKWSVYAEVLLFFGHLEIGLLWSRCHGRFNSLVGPGIHMCSSFLVSWF